MQPVYIARKGTARRGDLCISTMLASRTQVDGDDGPPILAA
jgi:hypothetical protein